MPHSDSDSRPRRPPELIGTIYVKSLAAGADEDAAAGLASEFDTEPGE